MRRKLCDVGFDHRGAGEHANNPESELNTVAFDFNPGCFLSNTATKMRFVNKGMC